MWVVTDGHGDYSLWCSCWWIPHGPLLCSCHYGCVANKAAASSSLNSMSSRNTYTAITPEYADFPVPHTPIPSALNPSSSRRHAEDHEDYRPSVEGEGSDPSRIRNWLASVNDVVQRNTGLLLVVASQVFFSLMNAAVKMLNSIDPPITALEVCFFSFLSLKWSSWYFSLWLFEWYARYIPIDFFVSWNAFTQIITYVCCMAYM